MKVSIDWMSEIMGRSLDAVQAADRLTMAGLEVESVEAAAPDFTGVVVGLVVEREKHPDADRLSVCRVDVGKGELLQIVCGAANVRADLKVAVVQVGGVLPGDFKIKRSKLRGVESQGMICSTTELGLGDDSDGIMELPEDAPVGEDFREYFRLNDAIVDVAITPNRGDCLSMLGVARELHALDRQVWDWPDIVDEDSVITDRIGVKLLAEAQCPRYVGRVVRGIDPKKPLPNWMNERLRRAGLRATGLLVVDIINYVMLELGQPMHAFDCAKVRGEVIVREAKAGESLQLLDGKSVTLQPGTLVIADPESVLAVAGVMGGDDSAVTADTTDVFLESAYFAPGAVSAAARNHAVGSESQYRFERGVDPEGQHRALQRLTQLLIEIAGGQVGPIVEAVAKNELPVRAAVPLRLATIVRYLGMDLPSAEVEQILSCLGMQVQRDGEQAWSVVPPAHRFDIEYEVDLIEELARLVGYDRVPAQPLVGELFMPKEAGNTKESRVLQAKNILVERGFTEVVTYSFVDPNQELMLSGEGKPALALANPLSRDMSVMRRTMWAGLLQVLQYNVNRQQHRVRCFEHGKCFYPGESGDIVQVDKLSGMLVGSRLAPQWGAEESQVDFYDLKGDLEQLLEGLRVAVTWRPSESKVLHPHQQLAIYCADTCVGVLGALHPRLVEEMGLGVQPYLFELDWEQLGTGVLPRFAAYSRFPCTKRDLSLIADESVTAEEICYKVRKLAGPLLKKVQIFDIYRSDRVGEGKKSVSLGLSFQDPSRTLVDEEVDQVIQRIVDGLASELNVQLRA